MGGIYVLNWASLYLSIETVVLGGLGYCLTANLVQKFAKKYLKLGGDVTFQAVSFSRLIAVNRCQRQNTTQINGFLSIFWFFFIFFAKIVIFYQATTKIVPFNSVHWDLLIGTFSAFGKSIGPIVIEISRFSEISCIFNACRQTDTCKMPFNSPFQDKSNGLGLGTVWHIFQPRKKSTQPRKKSEKMEKTHFFRFESPYQSPDGRFLSVFAPTNVKLKTIRSRIFDPKGVKNRPHLTPRPTTAVKPKCQLQKKKPKFIIWVVFLTLTRVNCDQPQIGFALKSYISYKSQIFFCKFLDKVCS